MSTKDKPIAAPRKGRAAGHWGKPTACRIGTEVRMSSKKERNSLVGRVTGVRSGSREKILIKVKRGLKFTAIAQLENELHASQKDIA
ncbi:MAG: hypothetical protein KZQ86_12695, partial [Candidatus Thiodiazotropha sp. (ex Lucinoma kastoroae)]|nr:hypothetical protein [Candidatus Thiodiazotropha sp. (ex Lucinoma kastoroae)]